MTLDELKKIDSDAAVAKRSAESLRYAASRLANLRTKEPGTTASEVWEAMTRHYGALDGVARDTLMDVLNGQIIDALRIAELRLEARARVASAKHRALSEQVRSFFDEEASQ